MLEIFALPYLATTGLIGWLVFGPFFQLNETQPLSLSKVAISDLLAVSLPVGALFSFTRWLLPPESQSTWVQLIVFFSNLSFAAGSLITGLLLMPKKFQIPFLKRITVVGIIAPFGILTTAGWIVFLVWAGQYSVMLLAPAMLFIAALTFGLRLLTLWVCNTEVLAEANP
ncbi:MAG: hypothetical protein AAF483_07165 [Planctomycetota bacterium]